jgi:tRNA dimethylallyltransferase
MDQQRVIVITGPTGSGKSALALALAEKRRGTVINADAMQTYDTFPILTAQPAAEERARAPHVLYGVLPLSETLSAARWRTLAMREIERCLAEGRTPILCGGSGLYLKALMQGIDAMPDPLPGLRDQANADWQAMGAEAFRARLAEKDPEIMARLKPGDRQRHVRAWEVWLATGRPLSGWQAGEAQPSPWHFTVVLLAPERGWLRARIETRFDTMMEAGVVAEVRSVFARSPDPRWPGLKAHGAPELFN